MKLIKLLIILTLIVSCEAAIKKKSLKTNEKVILPESWKIIYGENSPNKLLNKDKPIILVYINGDCYTCINELIKWDNFLDNFDSYDKFSFHFFTDVFDEDKFTEIIKTKISFSQPIYNDKSESFWKLNKISLYKKVKVCIISDSLFVYQGSPFSNNDEMKSFNEIIAKLLK